MGDPLLDAEDVGKKLKVSKKTIANWVAGRKSGFPRGFKIGTGPAAPRRWRESVIDDYIKSQEKNAA